MSMWEVYDELIALVPEDLRIEACLIGIHWTMVRSQGLGLAHTPFGTTPELGASGASATAGIGDQIVGMAARRLAGFIKSWNPFEASLGLAAMNSVFNSPELTEKLLGEPASQQPNISAFACYADRLKGRRVAVIGRFPDLKPLENICELSVLERRPGKEDLPDTACEYVLPHQDFVFMTATTLLSKTFPRLLELSRNAFKVMVGPSTPMTPLLFRYGLDALAGTVILNSDRVWQAVQEGAARGIFDCGAQMVKLNREEWEQTQQR